MTLCFGLTAVSETDAGNQVHGSYGKKCNSLLFLGHGFCLENNSYNLVSLELPEIGDSHPHSHDARNVGQMDLRARAFAILLDHAHARSLCMFCYLRLMCSRDIAATAKARRLNGKLDSLPAISIENELAVLARLVSSCQRSLARYSSSLADDAAELARTDLPRKTRVVVLLGQGEERILHHYLELSRMAMKILGAPTHTLRPAIAEEAMTGRPYATYFQCLDRLLD